MITNNCEIKRNEIWLANLGEKVGSEQGGVRPVLIIQNNIGNKYSPTITIAPITSKTKNKLPTHVILDNEQCLSEISIVLIEQITTINKSKLLKKMGQVSKQQLLAIEKAIKIQNGIINDFEFLEANEMLDQIRYINGIIGKFGKIKDLLIIKKYLIGKYIKYCNNYNVDPLYVKNKYINNKSNTVNASILEMVN